MNDLIVKDVPFCGTELLAVQQKENGKIYVGINSILRELGFNEEQVRYRRDKWNADKVLSKGVQKFSHPLKDGGTQETYCMEIKRLPLALAKIEITPKMEKEMPELSEKLEKYQDECADVLAEAFLPQAHNVKQLTITSRDIAIMTTSKNLHGKVVQNIKDCITELEQMGFNVSEFFILDSYIGANKQENPQYICTERGCEYYSGKLESEKRKVFIEEFTDRFERMRNVLEGKPVKKMPKAVCPADVQEKEPLIRLYKNNAWGILLADNEVYILNPGDIETLSRFISEMEKQNIGQIQCVVSAFLKSMKKSERLEEITSWGVKEQSKELLPDKAAQKPKRTSSRDDNAPFITFEQAKNRYNMGFTKITQLAKESGALIRYGKSVRYDRAKMDAYLAKEYSE